MPDFNVMYELYDPCTIMFFFRNKHIMIDLGTGNNNKVRHVVCYRLCRWGAGALATFSDRPLD